MTMERHSQTPPFTVNGRTIIHEKHGRKLSLLTQTECLLLMRKLGAVSVFMSKRMVIIYLLREWIFIGVRAFLLSSKMASGNLMGNDER